MRCCAAVAGALRGSPHSPRDRRRTAIDHFADQAGAEGADAVLVMIEGRVAIARSAIAEPMLTASIRKPILGALIGIAVEERALSTGDPLGRFGLGDELTDTERRAGGANAHAAGRKTGQGVHQ